MQACFEVDCDSEISRIEKLAYDFTIEKKYIKDHRGHLEGHDRNGNYQKFEYYGFFDLDKLCTKGDRFFKNSGEMIFILKKHNIEYNFLWNCYSAGTLLSTDSIK